MWASPTDPEHEKALFSSCLTQNFCLFFPLPELQMAEHFPVMPCFHLRLSDGFTSSGAISQALVVGGNVVGLLKREWMSQNLKMEKQAKNIEVRAWICELSWNSC